MAISRSIVQHLLVISVVAGGMRASLADNLPLSHGKAETPATRALSAEEAVRILNEIGCFRPRVSRYSHARTRRIQWTRHLASLVRQHRPAPDLAAELNDLQSLQQRLELRNCRDPTESAMPRQRPPSWIWYPKGARSKTLPRKHGIFAVDSNCRKTRFIGGVTNRRGRLLRGLSQRRSRVGAHETWQRAGVFSVEQWLEERLDVLQYELRTDRLCPKTRPG